MNVIAEGKKYAKKPWVILAVGVLLGGTVLAGIVALVVSKAKSLAGKAAGAVTSNSVAAGVGPSK